jgi:hypothetical protein
MTNSAAISAKGDWISVSIMPARRLGWAEWGVNTPKNSQS